MKNNIHILHKKIILLKEELFSHCIKHIAIDGIQ